MWNDIHTSFRHEQLWLWVKRFTLDLTGFGRLPTCFWILALSLPTSCRSQTQVHKLQRSIFLCLLGFPGQCLCCEGLPWYQGVSRQPRLAGKGWALLLGESTCPDWHPIKKPLFLDFLGGPVLLPVQRIPVWSLVGEDSACRRAAKPTCDNYWAASCKYWSPQAQEPVPHSKRSHQWETHTQQLDSSPIHCNKRKPMGSNKDPAQPNK